MLAFLRQAPSPLYGRRGVDLDFPMLAGCLALLGLGLVMITSASSEVAAVNSGNPLYHMIRHLIYVVLGLGAGAAMLLVPLSFWQRMDWMLLLAAFGLLILVLLPGIGREVNGSMIYLAGYLVRRQEEVRESLWGFAKPFLVLLPMAFLLLLEPDFGATVVMMGAAVAMLFLGGVGMIRFSLLVIAAVGAVVVLVQTQEYRLQRLITFTDPWADQYGAGYQLTQALIAFGRGEWFGVGLGNSVQKQFYLPEAHTDFVFSVLAEELGMIGALATIALFAFVGVRALYIGLWAEKARQFFAAYVAWGLAFLWLGQFLINVGVNVGLLPTKGLTLPFLSYGGSSLVVTCASMALLLRIEWESRTVLGSEDTEFDESDFAEPSAKEVAHGR